MSKSKWEGLLKLCPQQADNTSYLFIAGGKEGFKMGLLDFLFKRSLHYLFCPQCICGVNMPMVEFELFPLAGKILVCQKCNEVYHAIFRSKKKKMLLSLVSVPRDYSGPITTVLEPHELRKVNRREAGSDLKLLNLMLA